MLIKIQKPTQWEALCVIKAHTRFMNINKEGLLIVQNLCTFHMNNYSHYSLVIHDVHLKRGPGGYFQLIVQRVFSQNIATL